MSTLTLRERVAFAFKALTSTFDTQGSTYARQLMGGIFPASTGPYPARNTYQLLNTMNDSPWVRACAGRVADARACIMWKAYALKKNGKIATQRDVEFIQKAPLIHRKALLKEVAQDGELVELNNHIMLSMLRSGSSALTGWDTRWLNSVYLDTVGESFALKQRNRAGVPVASWVFPPHWIAETPTPQRPAYRLAWKALHVDIPESEIMWMKQPNCLEPYERGSGITKALDDDLATDEFAAKHCHDDQTECLTRRGWVNGLEVTLDDEIATWNHEDSRIEYHRPMYITNVPYNGMMHHWEGEHVDACVTPTHRMWIEQKEVTGKGRTRSSQEMSWVFAQSQEVAANPGRIIHWRNAGWYEGTQDSLVIPAQARITKRKPGSRGGGRAPMFGVNDEQTFKVHDFARFLGYYVSEGSLSKKGGACLDLCQTEGRFVEDIRASLQVFPSAWVKETVSKNTVKKQYKWSIRHSGLTEWARKECGVGAYHKKLPQAVFEWPRAAQLELFDGLMNGDGCRQRETFGTYDTRSKQLADDVQRLCVQLGYGSGIKIYRNRNAWNYSVRIYFTQNKRRIGKQAAWVEGKPYDGRVWCVTVPNERFISRRHGCVMIGGNTLKFFKNSARPDLLIMPKDGNVFGEDEAQRFEEWWQSKVGGFWRSFKPLFIKAPVEVKLIEAKFRDMQLTELRQHERDTVMQVWGIPPEIFGVLTSSNRSTIDQSGTIFNKYCIVPRVERERDFYQERLVPEYDDGKNRIILDYVSPVPEDKEFALKVMVAQPTCFQKNEFRALSGADPLDDFGDDLVEAAVPVGVGAEEEEEDSDKPKTPKAKPRYDNLDDEEAAALYLINRKLHSDLTL